jgi:hypothetical protein
MTGSVEPFEGVWPNGRLETAPAFDCRKHRALKTAQVVSVNWWKMVGAHPRELIG